MQNEQPQIKDVSDLRKCLKKEIFQFMGILKMKVKAVNQVEKNEWMPENSSNNIVNHQADQQLTEQTHNSVESENTIQEAGEVTMLVFVTVNFT